MLGEEISQGAYYAVMEGSATGRGNWGLGGLRVAPLGGRVGKGTLLAHAMVPAWRAARLLAARLHSIDGGMA